VKKAAAIHEIVESIALVPDHVLRALYMQQCSHLLGVNEQALVSELNKVLRKRFRKDLGDGAYVPDEQLAPDVAPQQTRPEPVGTNVQERDLLRMLLCYGHEKVMAPFFDEDKGEKVEEETSVAELMFEMLAMDDILFDEPIFRDIYLDYRHNSNLGAAVSATHYVGHAQEDWRRTAIDLITEQHVLSPNWKERHKIHVKRENESMFTALEEAVYILKERRLDRMIKELQEKLKTAGEDDILILLNEIKVKNTFKLQLAKKTGRVVVG
jgi:DNA primase